MAEGKREVYTNANYNVFSSPKPFEKLLFEYILVINKSIISESGDQELRMIPIAKTSDQEFINNLLGIHKNLIEELNDEAEFVKEAKELISLKEKLQTDKRQLEQKFDMYTRIPILPNNCKYIGWALSGFLDTIKEKIKGILKSIISKLPK